MVTRIWSFAGRKAFESGTKQQSISTIHNGLPQPTLENHVCLLLNSFIVVYIRKTPAKFQSNWRWFAIDLIHDGGPTDYKRATIYVVVAGFSSKSTWSTVQAQREKKK